ncbi:vesicule-associated membrane protein [Trypanosoma grayi]|uniref:vesicule-associated membrane protein n=1 Tax=Trypanosoma grayi TaxID=71804 RepID=UPI0004F40519|nr:vesicule-associated membrane protein [Trypanosoma grayi]KEG09914.1 vesicule-associated membrane protein [Trypanosoma grayi]
MQGNSKIYGGVVVRLSDRLMLCKAPGCPTSDLAIPGTAWADVVSKCSAPNFRTTTLVTLNNSEAASLSIPAEGAEAAAAGPNQLSCHIMTDNDLAFAILADTAVGRRQGHAALDEAAKMFHKMFVESVSKLTPRAVDVFVKPYRDLLLRMSEGDESEDKVRKLKKTVAEVKDIALDNVERVIQRGQRIDDIVQSTEDLQFQAQGFQRSSRDLRQQLWWNSVKGKLMIGGVAAFFILIVLFVFSSGDGQNK